MINLQDQKNLMLERLAYYKRVINIRSEGYRKHKLKYSIPRTEKALLKIEGGIYGICEDCGDQISDERLFAVPAALLCVDCQRVYEKRQK